MMSNLLPPDDPRGYLRARVKAHRLAEAARHHPAPVRLETGHWAPPNTRAVWHLPVAVPDIGEQVLQILWREEGDAFTLRILPLAEGGGL